MFVSKVVVVPFLLNVTQSVHIKFRNIDAYEKQAVVTFFLSWSKERSVCSFQPLREE